MLSQVKDHRQPDTPPLDTKVLAFEIHMNNQNTTCFGEAQKILMIQAALQISFSLLGQGEEK